MTTISWLKSASAGLLVALLAACGGGSSTTPAPEVAWASPAVFVTPGQSSKTFALNGCTKSTFSSTSVPTGFESPQAVPEVVLYTATLRITSEGNLSIAAAVSPTGAITEQWSMTYAEAQAMGWNVSGTTQTPTYELSASIGNTLKGGDGKSFFAYTSPAGEPSKLSARQLSTVLDVQTEVEINCDMTDLPALQLIVDQARAAKNLGSAAGITTYDDRAIRNGRIESGNAFWESNTAETTTDPFKFVRFNLTSGELASSTATTGTYSAINLSLPSNSEILTKGFYGETLTRGDVVFDAKDAKTLCLSRSINLPNSSFGVQATAYGTKLYPAIAFANPRGCLPPVATKG